MPNCSNIIDKLDYAFQPIVYAHNGKTYAVEALLRDVQNIPKVSTIDDLFDLVFNKSYSQGNTERILKKYNLTKDRIFFELSEKGIPIEQNALSSMLQRYKSSGYKIAIDDFDQVLSELKKESKSSKKPTYRVL